MRASAGAALVLAGVALTPDAAGARLDPWFSSRVGRATQVVEVVGRGGSVATLSAWARRGTTWIRAIPGVPARVGSRGISSAYSERSTATPAGVFALPLAFGRKPNPGSGLPYIRVDRHHWWVSDVRSPAYNTLRRCAPGSCPFNEAAGENLGRAGAVYNYAIVMGVNPMRKRGAGSAYFLHISNGRPTAGCAAISAGTLLQLIRWLRRGAVIAVKPATSAR
jgi:L,D-peptidoglycan transpeptidase YkuD (ErfK/YbiS/YcfS/YnhG family)